VGVVDDADTVPFPRFKRIPSDELSPEQRGIAARIEVLMVIINTDPDEQLLRAIVAQGMAPYLHGMVLQGEISVVATTGRLLKDLGVAVEVPAESPRANRVLLRPTFRGTSVLDVCNDLIWSGSLPTADPKSAPAWTDVLASGGEINDRGKSLLRWLAFGKAVGAVGA